LSGPLWVVSSRPAVPQKGKTDPGPGACHVRRDPRWGCADPACSPRLAPRGRSRQRPSPTAGTDASASGLPRSPL